MDKVTVESIITKSNIVELLEGLNNRSGELKSLVTVYIDDNGETHVLYAGFTDLELVGILEWAKIGVYTMITEDE